MNISTPDRESGSLVAAMRNQIHATRMPPRRRLRAPAVRLAGHRRMLAGGATAALAASTAAVLAVGAATTTQPAFAVADNADGSVTITLNEITGVSGLNAKLASMGVAIRAVPVVSGCDAPAQVAGSDGGPAGTLAVSSLPSNPRTGGPSTLRAITLNPPRVPGQTRIVAASATGIAVLGQTVTGQIPSCVAPADSTPAAGSPTVNVGRSTIQLGPSR